jgi:ribonuclease BN (tRNA processing enzyme)
MPEFQLIPLGVGDAFTAHHYTTCLALGIDDQWLLIDCPHPVRKMWREASLSALGRPIDLDQVVGVAITHLHADHASGLEDFAYFNYFMLKRRPLWLAHPDVSANLWSGLLSAGMGRTRLTPEGVATRHQLNEYIDLIPLSTSKAVEFGPFAIECRTTVHSIPTTAMKIKALGRTLGFSADSAYDPTLIDWLSDADLIVHEATSLPESPVHTPYRHLAQLPDELRKKMRLSHLPDNFDEASSVIEVLKEGRCYVV